ncbi:MAG: hypothetical protein AB7G08_14185, partial [Hyphomicrobiaceae bacterium]
AGDSSGVGDAEVVFAVAPHRLSILRAPKSPFLAPDAPNIECRPWASITRLIDSAIVNLLFSLQGKGVSR